MRASCLAVLICALSAQTPQPPVPTFRSGIDVVSVDVLVTDGSRTITGLRREDFALSDSGVPQEIDSVSVDTVPVSLLLALDTSNSVDGPMLGYLKAAARAAVHALSEDDRVAVMTFATAIRLRAGWMRPSEQTDDAIGAATAGGSTSLYDAAYAALALRDDQPDRRPFVILFSDGVDTSSWLPARTVLERAQHSDAVVYLVTTHTPRFDTRLEYRPGVQLWRGDGGFNASRPPIVELSALTGGRVVIADRPERLRDSFSAVISQFRTRYLLRYRPQGVKAAGWHPILVRVKGHRGEVLARRGYSR